MKPPIELVTDKVELASRINRCIDDTVYFAEQFLGYEDIFYYNKEFLACEDRFIVARYGRQSGKTKNVAVKALHFGYFASIKASHIKDHSITILCVSQSEKQAGLIFDQLRDWIYCSTIIQNKIVKETKTEIWIKSFDDSKTIKFIVIPTGDTGKSVRGYTAALIIIDEANYIPMLVYNALLPAGSAVKARIYVLSTPSERAGMYFEICESSHTIYKNDKEDPSYDPDKPENTYKRMALHDYDNEQYIWTQFHISSWDNPVNKTDPVFLNMIKRMSKTKQKAELEAEFLDAGASLLSHELLVDAFSKKDVTKEEIDYWTLGVDTSGKGADETVLIDVAVTKSGHCLPSDAYTEETTDQTLLAKIIEKRHKIKHYRNIYIDSTGLGEGLVDACKHVNTPLPVMAVNFKKEKVEIFNGLVILFENRNINFTNFPEEYIDKCRQQLQYLYADYGLHGDGTVKIRTHDDHDDFPDALALACYSQYGGEEWHKLPDDIMDPDLVPPESEKEEDEEPTYWLGSLRL